MNPVDRQSFRKEIDRYVILLRTIVLLVLASFSSLAVAQGGARTTQEPFRAEWASLARHDEAPEWFRDAKFGIYFHWGVYSVPAFSSEWYPRHMHQEGHQAYEYHQATYGDPSKFGYHDFVPRFTAEHFDAVVWAELFARARGRDSRGRWPSTTTASRCGRASSRRGTPPTAGRSGTFSVSSRRRFVRRT